MYNNIYMYIPRYKEHFLDIKKIAKENKKKKKNCLVKAKNYRAIIIERS